MAPTARSLTIAPFRTRSFRYQWPADLLTSWAFEMETLILGWYVIVQTESVLLLTAFGSLQFLGTLAAPLFGVLGDRVGGRAILCAMRASYAVLAAGLAVLGWSGALTAVQVFAVAAASGFLRPNDQLMRNALIGDTIPREHLMGALGLSRVTMDSARVGGALAGAGVSAALGLGPAYALVTLLYVASLALTFGVARARPLPDPAAGDTARDAAPAPASLPAPPSAWGDLRDGVAYVRATPRVLAALWLAFLVNLTAYPTSAGLLPYVARSVYRADEHGLGWLVASFSAGALLGSLGMVVTGRPRHPERSMLVNTALWYGLLLLFSHVRTMPVGLAVLALAGVAQSLAMVSMSVSLLAAAGARFRARVMGIRMLAVYGLPLGLLAAGAGIGAIGFPATITAYCAAGLALTALIAVRWRAHLWRA